MLRRKLLSVFLVYTFLLPAAAFAQTAKVYEAPKETIELIKTEGTKNSQVMQTLSYLTDVIGARLTNSPNMKRANEWTRDTMSKWGMQNAKLEAWGPWGRGWSLKGFNAQVVAPQAFPVIAYPKAWTTSTKGAITADVVYFDAKTEADLDKFKGKLSGKIVLISPTRDLKSEDKPLAERHTEESLKEMADATSPTIPRPPAPKPTEEELKKQRETQMFNNFRRPNFLLQEGAAVIVDNSRLGSGGTLFVQSAAAVQETPADITTFNFRNALQPYKKEAEAKIIPQMTMATEDYNRLVRMIGLGVTPRMTVDIQAQYHDEDQMGYNTIAEIPGTDPKLKDEVVMLGGHLDSWHSSTGATDNAAGCAVAMEAARIILASGLKPRRTIRVALWSGEEQGLNGSREYVKQHFGEAKGGGFGGGGGGGQQQQPVEITKLADYEKLSAYYNLDNGTGKIRGIYMQGNAAVAPIFKLWLTPFADMGANTVTILNTGGTDHLSFDRIGLPGFQFIQDEVEYDTRTHHSNQDNYDRIQAEDMKQASIVMAAFVYQTAMMDEKMPRKTVK